MNTNNSFRFLRFSALLLIVLYFSLFISCDSDEDTLLPKPRGYFRIDLPEKKYQSYNSDCPFTFEVPTYAFIHPDEGKNAEPCWLNIDLPRFKGRVHISYKQIENNLPTYLEDARSLAAKHQLKASAISEMVVKHDSLNVYGLIYDIEGNAASSLQFYLTDSTRNFLRGALYFIVPPNSDSLAPVVEFIRKDVFRLIDTFHWKEGDQLTKPASR
ncbi:MAG: gliding motility lipoprotein GldD [Bacteroidetes bacterium]|nr:gliding motility lipoprotein GldD [Bacteroidota bacterium]